MKDFTQLPDLASERLGGRVIEANDDYFGSKQSLLKHAQPIFVEGKYTARGKWMDGWETRRRRTPGHDWCVIRLGLSGMIRGIVVDTSFFRGNFPERFSLEGCDLGPIPPNKSERAKLKSSKTGWQRIFPETQLAGDSRNSFSVENPNRFTHLRFKIFPDGGVARLRIHGEAVPDARRAARGEIDLVAVGNGGGVVDSSDEFFGAPLNLLMPYRAKNMGDGWETKRRRGPGHDWVVLKLGVPGTIHRIEVDTAHFKGNFPDRCSLETCRASAISLDAEIAKTQAWHEILPVTKLKPHHRHIFKTLAAREVATHVRFHIYPDGGVSRLRLFGRADKILHPSRCLARLNRLSRSIAIKSLLDCCGARKWAEEMARQKPFGSDAQLFEAADKIWNALTREEWLEAFRHHPPIGGNRAEAKQSTMQSKWSANEQSQVQAASPDLLTALASENQVYAAKFGYVFLICATGKTSEEVLTALQRRMSNDDETELRIAAGEQRKITRLRLEKLLNS